MIINLWSTPRTGSVWYSHHLSSQYPGSLLVTEMFNRFHMNMYHVRGDDGSIRNYHHPVDGGFYKEYYLDENNYLIKRAVHGIRTRLPDEEEQYCLDLLQRASVQQILILHNHIDPINMGIRDWLIDIAYRNIWIYRQDRRQQIASYAIALSTKKFAAFSKAAVSHESVDDCDVGPLENLVRRIGVWDSMSKNPGDIVAFENIPFYDASGYPVDQNMDPWSRLSHNMKNTINRLVEQYENDTNKRC